MNAIDMSRELPVWIGGLGGLFVMTTILMWFKRSPSADAPRPQAPATINPETALFFQVFAATFIACALLQDFTLVFLPAFPIPLSAKYVMALCASLPAYLLRRRG
ncbi:MAG: hypothetical protein ACKN9T_06700 [Candidatus Methylumidiphilus sp.]